MGKLFLYWHCIVYSFSSACLASAREMEIKIRIDEPGQATQLSHLGLDEIFTLMRAMP
jgi:hypothetical protein